MARHRTIGEILNSVSITHDFKKDKLIFLNTSDVLEGKILVDTYVDVSGLKGQAKKTIQNGDILYSEIRPKNRRYAYVKVKNPEDYVVSTKLMVLRNKTTDVLTDYVYYFLTYQGTLDYLQMRAENRIGSFPQITFDLVKGLGLEVPDVPTQQKIAAVLSALDAKIDCNNRIIAEAPLPFGYYYKDAGPYDPNFMNAVAGNFKKSAWFEERQYRWHPLEKVAQIEGYYTDWFAPALPRLAHLFALLADKTEAESEIIATLYAVWNNRIILGQPIIDDALLTDFYDWSKRKHQYSETELHHWLAWMRANGIAPMGFGKELKRAKEKR